MTAAEAVSRSLTARRAPSAECLLDPLAVHSDMALTSDWNGARQLGAEVRFTCLPGLTTDDGFNVQLQTCTLDGWVSRDAPRDWRTDTPGSGLPTQLNSR